MDISPHEDDLPEIADQARTAQRRVEQIEIELASVVGQGDAADGAVHARADGQGRILEVGIGESAMALGSDLLGEEITLAVRRARESVEREQQALARDALNGRSVETMETELDEAFDSYRRSMETRLEELDRLFGELD